MSIIPDMIQDRKNFQFINCSLWHLSYLSDAPLKIIREPRMRTSDVDIVTTNRNSR